MNLYMSILVTMFAEKGLKKGITKMLEVAGNVRNLKMTMMFGSCTGFVQFLPVVGGNLD